MIGKVDDQARALLDVSISAKLQGPYQAITTWIDTAFDGHLVFSSELVEELGLESLADTEAILADGTQVCLETFLCYVKWFGHTMPLLVIANDGRLPLLGTGLLADRILHIDYSSGQLSLE